MIITRQEHKGLVGLAPDEMAITFTRNGMDFYATADGKETHEGKNTLTPWFVTAAAIMDMKMTDPVAFSKVIMVHWLKVLGEVKESLKKETSTKTSEDTDNAIHEQAQSAAGDHESSPE
jgi:hypothetical protein